MVIIYDSNMKPVSHSRNLRGILDYSRKHAVAKVRLTQYKIVGGMLHIEWMNGATVCTIFASWTVLKSWVRGRKNLRGALLVVNGMPQWTVTRSNP